jgi:hypothetical protein
VFSHFTQEELEKLRQSKHKGLLHRLQDLLLIQPLSHVLVQVEQVLFISNELNEQREREEE